MVEAIDHVVNLDSNLVDDDSKLFDPVDHFIDLDSKLVDRDNDVVDLF